MEPIPHWYLFLGIFLVQNWYRKDVQSGDELAYYVVQMPSGLALKWILLANASCTDRKHHQLDESGLTGFARAMCRRAKHQPDEAHGGRRQYVLQMRLRQPDAAEAPQVQDLDAHRDCSLNSSALLVVSCKGRLVPGNRSAAELVGWL